MNIRHRKFIKEYLVDQNASRAAIAAGYPARSSRSMGHKLFTRVDIKAEIDAGLNEQLKEIERRALKYQLTKERWLKEMALIAFADMDDFAKITATGINLIATQEREQGLGKVIKKVSESSSQHGGSHSLELHPKLPALELIGKHFGWLQDSVKLDANVKSTNQHELMGIVFKTQKSSELALQLAEEIEAQHDKERGEQNGKS